jgi:hypothetical protein
MPPLSKITRPSAAVTFFSSTFIYLHRIGKPWRKSEDTIRININEMGCKDVNLIRLVENVDRLCGYLNTIMRFALRKGGERLSRRTADLSIRYPVCPNRILFTCK